GRAVVAALQAQQMDVVGLAHFLQHPAHDGGARRRGVVERQLGHDGLPFLLAGVAHARSGGSRTCSRSRQIGLNVAVGVPSAPTLLLLWLLPYEISWPPLRALMPVPLRVMVSLLSRMVACGPLASSPMPPLFTMREPSTNARAGALPALVVAK